MNKIEIDESVQILTKDEILETKCTSIHTSESSSVKETTYMLSSTDEDKSKEIWISILIKEKKGEGRGIDTRTEEVSAS